MPDDALPDPSTTDQQAAPPAERLTPARPRRAAAPAPAPVPRRRGASPAPAPVPATSPSITSKLQELEARLAVASPVPVEGVPQQATAPKIVPARRSAKRAPVVPASPVRREPPARPPRVNVAVPPVPIEEPAPAVPAQPTQSAGLRAAVLLIVLLLAAAAGLGAAALALTRTATWEATSVVQLVPVASTGSQDLLKAAVVKYEQQLAGRDLTTEASASVGLQRSELTQKITAKPSGADKIRLVVRAGSAGDAELVAQAAGAALVDLVVVDQINSAPTPEATLSATVVGKPDPHRVEPSNTDVWVASGLAAAGMLVLAGIVAALRRGRAEKAA